MKESKEETKLQSEQKMIGSNNMKTTLLKVLISYSSKYEITIQFWPNQTTVYIAKDGIDLFDYGGEDAIERSIEYLDRINPTSNA